MIGRGGVTLTGDWDKMIAFLQPLTKGKSKKMGQTLTAIGAYVKTEIKRAIKSRNYAPNHPYTILRKSTSSGAGDQPLVDHGQLNKSINYKLVLRGKSFDKAVFIGVAKGTKSTTGDDLVKIGAILHDGATIQVTDRMRQYLADTGLMLASSTRQLVIPPRPFIEAVVNDPQVSRKVKLMFLIGVREILLSAGRLK